MEKRRSITRKCVPKRKAAVDNKSEFSTESEELNNVSPNKVSKSQQEKQNFLSPSTLLDRLSLDEKPDKHEISDESSIRNKYKSARQVLNSTETICLPGREEELSKLKEFLISHAKCSKSGSLYVSGPPGTGKTACLSALLKSKELPFKFTTIYINCTSVSTIGNIYRKICDELKLKVQGRLEKDFLTAIHNHLSSRHGMILMVLDEIDQLCGKKQSVLYTIFEWPAIPNSKLILIGIANSLDLTDRFLARLNFKCDLKPSLMHFPSYTKQQIVDIFTSRLEKAGVLEIFPPTTMQLLAAKVSAVSGDVRRALDIGRRVIDLAEEQMESNNNQKLNVDNKLKPVQITQVSDVLKNVYGASQNLNEEIDESFPLQHKILICCLMLILRKAKNKDVTLGRLHDVYKRICSKLNIIAVDQAEFASCADLVEARGIIRIIRKKETRLNKIQLEWDEEEVNGALCDKQLIASILDDTSCLK